MQIKKNLGFYFGIATLLFACFMLWQSFNYKYYTDFGPGPGLLPRWLNGGLIILSLIYIYESVKKDVVLISEALPKGSVLKRVLMYPMTLVIFLLTVDFTGFIVAGTVTMLILLINEYKWYLALGISVVSTSIVFYAFKVLLHVPLPVNTFGW